MSQRQSSIWADAGGDSALVTMTTSAGAGAINLQLGALTNASVIQQWAGTLFAFAPAATAATYQSVNDRAVLFFGTAAGTIIKLLIPAPISAIFMADQETVNPASITALVTACIGNLSDALGNTANAYIGGTRS
jgi:hypothetical protein